MTGILEELGQGAIKHAGSVSPWLLVTVAKLTWFAYID